MNGQGSKPEKEFRVGAVRTAIWTNPRRTSDGRAFNSHKVLIERVYKDSQGNFKTTNSLDANDVPKAILALKEAYSYIMLKGNGAESWSGGNGGFSMTP